MDNLGVFPYNMLTEAFGPCILDQDKESLESRVRGFINSLERGGDKKIINDYGVCLYYYKDRKDVEDIAKICSISTKKVRKKIKRVIGLVSLYCHINPNMPKSVQDFTALIINRTGQPDALNALRAVGITSISKLTTYCTRNGTKFEKVPTLTKGAAKQIRMWVEDKPN